MRKTYKYKGVTVNAFGIPIFHDHESSGKRLKKSKRKYSEYRHFIHNFPLSAPKDLIIIVHIPSQKRSEKDWLRYQLKKFGYSMIQNNIWVGPSPLPKDFIQYIRSIGLIRYLAILPLAKPYSKNNQDLI